ncbi:hypothetical protein ASG67_06880 [Sphingomonas sp. Leaf339]|uniref:energy transducer TonB n=1 Tax=Sphingomonas sp. Leaf339 TaxID=1736343 RepID=UPI0006F2DDCF|nr:energy transducer TonB [Sphingomonas sp. Leaf339]KQU55831.1 hypothetical protein ASG67_06880 [Sphingomonas sp. Leaf339]
MLLYPTPAERLRAAIPTAIAVALLAWALIVGLRLRPVESPTEQPAVFKLDLPPPPPERIVPERQHRRRAQGRASPRNLRSKATEVAAPIPIIPPLIPPPIVTAPTPRAGYDPTAGASNRPGPGSGAGGQGDGDGSGGAGDGDGDGYESPPRRIAGRIKDSDYPRAAEDVGAGGTVSVRYHVETNGRVTGCAVTHSSGNAALDDTTCRLIERRFRYDPSRDAEGRPVRSIIVVDHDWVFDRDDPR